MPPAVRLSNNVGGYALSAISAAVTFRLKRLLCDAVPRAVSFVAVAAAEVAVAILKAAYIASQLASRSA